MTDSRNEPTRLPPIVILRDETRKVSIAGHRAAERLSLHEVDALQTPWERELPRLAAETDLRTSAAEIASALRKAAGTGVDGASGFRQALFLAALVALLDAGKLDAVEAVLRSLQADVVAADDAVAVASPLSAVLAIAVRAGISTTAAEEAASVAASRNASTHADVTRVLARIGAGHRVRLHPARGARRATEDAVISRIRIMRPRRQLREQRVRAARRALLRSGSDPPHVDGRTAASSSRKDGFAMREAATGIDDERGEERTREASVDVIAERDALKNAFDLHMENM